MADSITVWSMKESTNMPLEKFKASMIKLCHPQHGILKKSNPRTTNFADDESISVKENFSSAKIKINFIPI